jgi:8-oxo-dGTP pyrophosphatase MutT (NUDIX family)
VSREAGEPGKDVASVSEGFVECRCGDRHWGKLGASGLLLHRDGKVLLQRRAPRAHHGGTWALPGGARRSGESDLAAALREAREEADIDPDQVTPQWWYILDHGGWTYTTVCAQASGQLSAAITDTESTELEWVPTAQVPQKELLGLFASTWPDLVSHLDKRLTLVVDSANVVGSRPDGWWKDRRGAAQRLRDRLTGLAHRGLAGVSVGYDQVAGWWPDIILVVEGKARGVESIAGVTVRDAPGEGDPEILAQARAAEPPVAAVTSDKALTSALRAAGVHVVGPGTLASLM